MIDANADLLQWFIIDKMSSYDAATLALSKTLAARNKSALKKNKNVINKESL